jgi:D-arabinose 1-dehydrogenase-like Zn-dependent alcohol dehydrogenase
MKSHQIVEFGQPLEPRQYENPSPQGTEVLVRIHACGVCHSDLHLWSGYFDLGGGKRITLSERGVRLPFTLGHEIVGEVVAVGPEASGIEIGTRGVVYPWIGCGDCPPCRRGDELLCDAPRCLGTRRDGGYSDHVLVPHPRYIVDYGALDPATAATLACSGLTAHSALRKLPSLDADGCLLVIGAGGVGLAAVGIAAAVSPAKVIAADIDAAKREAALRAGAAAALDPAAPNAAAELRKLAPRQPRAVIDFVGAPASIRFALDGVARGGTVVVVGLYGGETTLPIPFLPLRMLELKGSYTGTLAELKELIALMQTGKVKTVPVATRPMTEINAILDDLKGGKIVGRVVATA